MKLNKNLFCFLFSMAALSCSEDEGPTVEPEPVAPGTPMLKLPQDNLQCSYSKLTFEWEPSEDPEKELIDYELEISKNESFSQLSHNRKTERTSANIELDSGTLYYWRVRASYRSGLQSEYSKTRTLSTEPVLSFNSVPYPAYSESPTNNATTTGKSIVLTWSGEDSDGDELSYDLYFDTSNPPELYKEDLEDNAFEVSLEEGTTYYWKVNVKDGKGAKAIGDIWTFTRTN